ncbi:polyunsaturated fatty acid 5-lipoxygenase-like isoform X2 [Porites lutea]|uniref:polyunsaturated fatty acid 5-lipoxygenase-like isoform X2 n=1 Tax=Porites lutea TaxID=51062 RepID=UPI003CC5BBA0
MSMNLQLFLLFLITIFRYVSATPCEVSLLQHASPACKVSRNAALNQNKKIWTLKHDPDLHGFALLNMTSEQLRAIALQDPFIRYYASAYLQTSQASNKSFHLYNSITAGQEITDITEYLKLSAFFQSALEPAIGEYARLPSRYEAFVDNKPEWINDKHFTQQRLAGPNPMSLKRVTVHGQEKRQCTVKTTDGRWCHFPFTYRGKVYHKCTTKDYHRRWCSTSPKYIFKNNFGRWGNCQGNEEQGMDDEDCSVKTTKGEWCHFPFTYYGKKYTKCTKDYHNRPWCSTTKNYRGKWGNCKGKEEKRGEQRGPIGLDWKELKATLNPTFKWQKAVQAALDTDDSLESAIDQGRIYALRYEMCDDMARSPDLTDRDPRRKMWNFLSPIALFASKGNKYGKNELVPVAIQMDYKPDSAVYTPEDGGNWMLAKLNVQITDLGYAQIVEHLAKIHYLMEPFCVILKRTFSSQHPLHQILKFHCREITVPNTFGTPKLVNEEAFMDLLFAHGNTGTIRLLKDSHKVATWEVTNLKEEVKKRGLDDRRLIPYFPYRDDGEEILGVIDDVVEKYVSLYYKDDKAVQEDKELEAFLNELSLNGTGENGGIGRIQKFPARIDSKEELCDIVTRIISHLSLQHTACNFLLADYAVYIPNLPTKLYNDTRVKEGEFSVYRLPNRVTSAIEASFSNSLASLRFDSLFDYGNSLEDSKAANIINNHYSYLMRVVQPKLQERNKKRKDKDDLTYPYFIPRWIPNGVQT